MTDDNRPANCRFRLKDEGKPYPRSGCQACGASITTGLGNACHRTTPRPQAIGEDMVERVRDAIIDASGHDWDDIFAEKLARAALEAASLTQGDTNDRMRGEAREALRWLASQKTVDELMSGESEYALLTVEQRIENMAERKQAHDRAVLNARQALSTNGKDGG